MRIAIFGNSTGVETGGGLVFIASIAAALAEEHDVHLLFPEPIEPGRLRQYLPAFPVMPQVGAAPLRSRNRVLGLVQQVIRDRQYDAIVVQSPLVPRLAFNRRSYLLCEFPFQEHLSRADEFRLRSFSHILTNSGYTASWIQRRWRRSAEVLYPTVVMVPVQEKRPYILSVGRFLGGSRPKRQLEKVHMFRQMVEGGLEGWELHLAGFVQDPGYAQSVVAAAEGLPVHFHFDLDRSELEVLLGESSIFWHGVGLGEDPEIRPERMEHFGIVTVEAMSAGCVPVVINRGGQPEIVGSAEAGCLWDTPEQAIAATWEVIRDAGRRASMQRAARERAEYFSLPRFIRRVQACFD